MLKRNEPAPSLDAPIPGQGLTAPLGDRPWQRPAELSTPEQALAFYVDRITDTKQASQMLDLLELGIPVDTLVDTIQLGGVMDGIHSVDVGMVIAPSLAEIIGDMADKADVKYKMLSNDDPEELPTKAEIALTLNDISNADVKTKEEPEQLQEAQEEEEPRGLMARRK
tara:strand:+ start:185 stop:688 length:504 start_codon:yes stop_codon:yes gene_type:complete